MVAAFEEQIESFLLKILSDKLIAYHTIDPVINKAFPEGLSLCSLDWDTVATGPEGAVIHV